MFTVGFYLHYYFFDLEVLFPCIARVYASIIYCRILVLHSDEV